MPSSVHIDANRTWGGGQEQSLALALALARRGDPTSFLVQTGSALAARLAATDLSWDTASLRGAAGLALLPKLAGRFRRLHPDVVHIHDSASHAVAGLAARRARVPAVIVTRRTDFPLRRSWLGRLKYHAWCDRIICISAAVRRRCLEAGLPERHLVVIPDFVDCQHFDPAAVAPVQRDERPTIAIVGRLTREKGHGVLLRAMSQVSRAFPNVRLLISGEGEEETAIRRQVRQEGLGNHVELAGFVSDVREVLSWADVFVMPSLTEGLGVAVLEAMAMAKAVVASDAGGLPEAVMDGESGLVVPAGDASALAEALIRLLRDPDRAREMGRAGRARALSRFDREQVVERILDLYRQVLEEG